MELSVSLQEHLAHSAFLHRRLCPRQVLGVRMARLACVQLGVDPALQHKRIFVYMENGHCVADGVISVTHASPTNQLMQLMDYGKMAATFVDLAGGQALRVCERPGCRETAIAMLTDAPSAWAAQVLGYQVMPNELLLSWQWVELQAPLPKLTAKHKVTCSRCSDYVHEHRELEVDGQILCKACAYGAYYKIIEPSHSGILEAYI